MKFYCRQHVMRIRDFESVSLRGARIVLGKVRRRYPWAKLFNEDGTAVPEKTTSVLSGRL